MPAVSKEKDPSSGVQYDSMEVQEVAPKDQHIDGSIPSHEQAPNVEEPMTHITGPTSALDTQHGMTSGKVFLFFFEEDGRPPISIKENKHSFTEF